MKHAIAIDLGGTAIKYALVNETYDIILSGETPSYAMVSAERVIEQIKYVIEQLKVYASQQKLKISGIGIGTPGIIDKKGRTVLGGADNIEGWENLPLADIIEAEACLPVRLENDANAMALGEVAAGAGKECTDMLFLTVGTGIGGAVFIDGSLFSGYRNRGGELGHITLFADGEDCTCGSKGCLEQYASTSALVRSFVRESALSGLHFTEKDVNGRMIIKRYFEECEVATKVIDEHCTYIGRGVASLINIFSPQKVLIGGGISEAGPFYIEKIRRVALRHAMPACSSETTIEAALLGSNAGCIGAASLILNV